MGREAEVFLARGLALLFLAGGLGLGALLLLAGGWPTIVPLVVAALGVPPLLLWLHARRASADGFLARHAGTASLACAVGACAVLALATGVEREERHEMAWSFEVDGQGRPDRRRILLEFVDHPGWVSKVTSADLGRYLESLGSDRVPVVYRVTRDFGRVRGFLEVQVGERRDWKDDGGGGFSRRTTERSRVAGGIGPSPFE